MSLNSSKKPTTFFYFHGFLGSPDDGAWLKKVTESKNWNLVCLKYPRNVKRDEFFEFLYKNICSYESDQSICYGYSMGGRILLEILQRNKDFNPSYVFIESSFTGELDADKKKERLAFNDKVLKSLNQKGDLEFYQWWYQQPLFGNCLKKIELASLPTIDRDFAKFSLLQLGPEHQNSYLAQLKNHPVVYMAGEKDQKYRQHLESLTRSGIKTVLIKGQYHKISALNPGPIENLIISNT